MKGAFAQERIVRCQKLFAQALKDFPEPSIQSAVQKVESALGKKIIDWQETTPSIVFLHQLVTFDRKFQSELRKAINSNERATSQQFVSLREQLESRTILQGEILEILQRIEARKKAEQN